MRALNILWSEERSVVLSLVIMSVLIGSIQAFEPILFGRVIDSLSQRAGVAHLLIFWGALSAINILSSVGLAVVSDRLAHRQRLNILDQVFERAIALPVSFHSEQGSGRLVHSILSGTDQLFNLWLTFMREHLYSLIGVCFLVPLAMSLNWKMATALFGLSIIYVAANFLIVRHTHALQERVTDYHQNVFSRVGDVIGNVTVVQSYTRLLQEIQELQKITAQLLSAQYPILTWWGVLSVITRISAALAMVSILMLGSWLVTRGELSIGQVVSFVSFSALLIGKMEQLSNFVSQVISRTPAIQKFFQLLDQGGAAHDTPNARHVANIRGEVEFRDVTYTYKNGKFGVANLCFKANVGETIALVGPSGSGKTTTLALLQRLFDPQEGTILVDGEDIRAFTLSSLRHSVAAVFQDSGLFNRSILENIRVGRPDANRVEIESAARQAQAHDFIMSKEGNYDFIIGERGMALSGGERQRIAIARAILKSAPILIFDEATSALDNQTEKKIQEALANLRSAQKTTFIIAHRLSTVTAADQILVFDQGRIVEQGTFQELQDRAGLFAALVSAGEVSPQVSRRIEIEAQ